MTWAIVGVAAALVALWAMLSAAAALCEVRRLVRGLRPSAPPPDFARAVGVVRRKAGAAGWCECGVPEYDIGEAGA